MTIQTWLLRRKWVLLAVGLPVLVPLWWAFRPEKLWINEKVNEPAPFDARSDPQPVLTGRFKSKTQQTTGRATIYKKPTGEEYLRLSDFTAQSDPEVHLALARGGDRDQAQEVLKDGLDRIDLGPLKANQGDQDYDLPAGTNLNKYDAVVIYNARSHMMLGFAKLEPF